MRKAGLVSLLARSYATLLAWNDICEQLPREEWTTGTRSDAPQQAETGYRQGM